MNDHSKEHYAPEHPLLFDGAMGTVFAALPGRAGERCERASLIHPEEISAIHRAYLKAGARAIKTNTFSVGADLAQGHDTLAEALIAAGCRLAKEAAEPYGAEVFADLGPIPRASGCDAGQLFILQAEQFLKAGVTRFLAETLSSDEGIPELAAFLQGRYPDSFLIVSYAVGADGFTREGLSGRELLRRTAALPGVDAVGFNCMSGPHHLLACIRGLKLEGAMLSVMPNAGYPTVLGRRTAYQGKPDYFAQQMIQILHAGAAIVGGCCGTTPDHIARLALLLREGAAPEPAPEPEAIPGPAVRAESDALWDKLRHGKKAVAVELDPPANDDISSFLSGVGTLRDAGADVVTIADCPVGRPRADSCLLACKIKRELGVETLPHMTCRDRNLNAIRALLLGLSIEDVHNILLVTGDPVPTESRDEVKSVFNFNSRKLARYVSTLSADTLSTPFHIFGALNLNARNFDVQLRLAKEKEEAGVQGFLTQPVLSAEALENLKRARAELNGKLFGGIFPVVSYRNACFLNNEVSGIRVCDEIIDLYRDKGRDECEAIALRVSSAIAGEIAPYVDGYYLMTPFQRVGLIARILQKMRENGLV